MDKTNEGTSKNPPAGENSGARLPVAQSSIDCINHALIPEQQKMNGSLGPTLPVGVGEVSDSSLNFVSIYQNPSSKNSNTEMLPRHMTSDSSSRRPPSSDESGSETGSDTLIAIGPEAPNVLSSSLSELIDTPGATFSEISGLNKRQTFSGTTVSSVQEVPSTSTMPSAYRQEELSSSENEGDLEFQSHSSVQMLPPRPEKLRIELSESATNFSEENSLPDILDTGFDDDSVLNEILKDFDAELTAEKAKKKANLARLQEESDHEDKTYKTLQPFITGIDGNRPPELTKLTEQFHPRFRRHSELAKSQNPGKLGPSVKSPKNQVNSARQAKQETPEVYESSTSKIKQLAKGNRMIPAPRLSYGGPFAYGTGHRPSTPMVKLTKIPADCNVECEILLKCEYMNSTGVGSYRIISELLERLENINVIDKDFTIVTATTTTIGLGVAVTCAEKGYQPPIIILTNTDPSEVDINMLLSLGAKVIRCPTDKTKVTPADKASDICSKLLEYRSKSWTLDIEKELKNTFKQCFSTGREIMEQCNNYADIIVCDGDSALLLEEIKTKMTSTGPTGKCYIVALETDPFVRKGSSTIYNWYQYKEKDAMIMARKLIRDEGILCGALGGALVDCAVNAAFDFSIHKKKTARVVVLFPGGFAQGDKQFLKDQWMIDKNCWLENEMECFHYWWWDLPISIIKMKEAVTVQADLSVRKALYIIETCNVNRLVIVNFPDGRQQNVPRGILTKSTIMNYLKEKENELAHAGAASPINRMVDLDLDNIKLNAIPWDQNISTATVDMKLKEAAKAFKTFHFLVIVQRSDVLFYKANILSTGQLQNVVGVVSPLDVLQYKKGVMEDHRNRYGIILKG